jgi:hypothetical protein
MIKAMGKRFAADCDRQIGHVGEIRQPHASRFVDLPEDYLLAEPDFEGSRVYPISLASTGESSREGAVWLLSALTLHLKSRLSRLKHSCEPVAVSGLTISRAYRELTLSDVSGNVSIKRPKGPLLSA